MYSQYYRGNNYDTDRSGPYTNNGFPSNESHQTYGYRSGTIPNNSSKGSGKGKTNQKGDRTVNSNSSKDIAKNHMNYIVHEIDHRNSTSMRQLAEYVSRYVAEFDVTVCSRVLKTIVRRLDESDCSMTDSDDYDCVSETDSPKPSG